MAKAPAPIDPATMILRASRALGKVDLHGTPRGVTMITTEEIEAMALLLAALGLSPLQPEDTPPADVRTLLNPR